MINFSEYTNKRVVLLIDARGYDPLQYSCSANTSLVLIADISLVETGAIKIKNISMKSDGLFDNGTNRRSTNFIRIKGGKIDISFIIGIFDDFEEVK